MKKYSLCFCRVAAAAFLFGVFASLPAQADGRWWHPPVGISWQIQYTGRINTSFDVAVYNLDLFDTSAPLIRSLHARKIRVICYLSAGSYENWRPDAGRFPAAVLGRSNGWPGERWLDIRRIGNLKPIMAARINLAVEKGCDAVDPDNLDGYDNRSGFPLTYADQLGYNRMIAGLAHAAGLAVGLKNDLDQIADLIGDFDFAVNEQCFQYHACDELAPFIAASKPVFNVEYNVPAAKFCPRANAMHFSSLKKDLELGPHTEFCR